MAINILTPLIAFPTTGAITAFAIPNSFPNSEEEIDNDQSGLMSAAGETEGPLMAATWAF
jgi:hypothetical protein